MIVTGIAADLFAECIGKSAGVAETGHVCDLADGIFAALQKRKTFMNAVFFQIAADGAASHCPEKAATHFPGQMKLPGEFRQ